MATCQFHNGKCKEPAVKGEKLCRKHKYYVNKQSKKPFKLMGETLLFGSSICNPYTTYKC